MASLISSCLLWRHLLHMNVWFTHIYVTFPIFNFSNIQRIVNLNSNIYVTCPIFQRRMCFRWCNLQCLLVSQRWPFFLLLAIIIILVIIIIIFTIWVFILVITIIIIIVLVIILVIILINSQWNSWSRKYWRSAEGEDLSSPTSSSPGNLKLITR